MAKALNSSSSQGSSTYPKFSDHERNRTPSSRWPNMVVEMIKMDDLRSIGDRSEGRSEVVVCVSSRCAMLWSVFCHVSRPNTNVSHPNTNSYVQTFFFERGRIISLFLGYNFSSPFSAYRRPTMSSFDSISEAPMAGSEHNNDQDIQFMSLGHC